MLLELINLNSKLLLKYCVRQVGPRAPILHALHSGSEAPRMFDPEVCLSQQIFDTQKLVLPTKYGPPKCLSKKCVAPKICFSQQIYLIIYIIA